MVNSLHTQENRERIIAAEQSGTAEPTLDEQIDFLSREIEKKSNSYHYYEAQGFDKLAKSLLKTISSLSMQCEILKARKLAAELDAFLPTFGGAMEFVKGETK